TTKRPPLVSQVRLRVLIATHSFDQVFVMPWMRAMPTPITGPPRTRSGCRWRRCGARGRGPQRGTRLQSRLHCGIASVETLTRTRSEPDAVQLQAVPVGRESRVVLEVPAASREEAAARLQGGLKLLLSHTRRQGEAGCG